jgi:hypothetical protein
VTVHIQLPEIPLMRPRLDIKKEEHREEAIAAITTSMTRPTRPATPTGISRPSAEKARPAFDQTKTTSADSARLCDCRRCSRETFAENDRIVALRRRHERFAKSTWPGML